MKAIIYYTLYNLTKFTEYPLSAKTDRGARIQAKKIIVDYPNDKWDLQFHRKTDGCKGSIDI